MQAPVPQSQAVVEFYIEPIIAWRAWQVEFHARRGILLRSVTYRTVWLRKKAGRAHCLTQINKRSAATPPSVKIEAHDCPNLQHGCGYYSVKEAQQAKTWAHNGNSVFRVLGTVKIWGKVYRFSEGYISEYAYPDVLYVSDDYTYWDSSKAKPDAEPEEVAELLQAAYGVDTQVGWPV